MSAAEKISLDIFKRFLSRGEDIKEFSFGLSDSHFILIRLMRCHKIILGNFRYFGFLFCSSARKRRIRKLRKGKREIRSELNRILLNPIVLVLSTHRLSLSIQTFGFVLLQRC
jgi:hypothetical protein